MPDLQGDVRQGAPQKRSSSVCHAVVRITSLLRWTYQHITSSLDSIVLVMHGAWLASAARVSASSLKSDGDWATEALHQHGPCQQLMACNFSFSSSGSLYSITAAHVIRVFRQDRCFRSWAAISRVKLPVVDSQHMQHSLIQEQENKPTSA